LRRFSINLSLSTVLRNDVPDFSCESAVAKEKLRKAPDASSRTSYRIL
jgi:hypothetical protein